MRKANWGAALAAGAMLWAGPAGANHQWGSYHWANNGTGISLNVYHLFRDGSWNSSSDNYYQRALAGWHQTLINGQTRTSPVTLVDRGRTNTTTTGRCDPMAGAVLVCSDAYGQRGWLGIASIWASGDHITQGTTKLNDTYYAMAAYNTPAYRDLVMCQEIGHDFGLGHQDETFSNYNLGSCMDYTSAPQGGLYNGFDYGPANRTPNAHDYDLLATNAMYGSGHNDGTSGGGGGGSGCNPRSPKCKAGPSPADPFAFRDVGAPGGGDGAPAFLNDGRWGKAVGVDREGRPNAFALDLGNGMRRLTHVYWVPGFRPDASHLHD